MNLFPTAHDLERSHGVTWGELAELEPRLHELLWKARAAGAGCRCREDMHRVFAPLRDALTELVGFMGRHRDHPVLGSVGAYEVAYWRLRDAVAQPLILAPGAACGACDTAAEMEPDAAPWSVGLSRLRRLSLYALGLGDKR